MKAFLAPVTLCTFLALEAAAQTRVTFSNDVAPILFAHCVSCHRPGEIGPFSLLTYGDARPWAAAIARATRARAMPPWKPAPAGEPLVGARRLTERQIQTIERWAREGAPEGDPAELPSAPTFPEGWRLGEPDLVITMDEPYTLPANGEDVLRHFVMPIPTRTTKYVSGIEFRPGNARVVHHANMRIDRTSASRALDDADPDPEPGFDGRLSSLSAMYPDGHFLGWTPGQLPPLLSPGMAWRLEPSSDLVLQLHMRPTAAPESVRASIGLFFTDHPPARAPVMLRLGRHDIDIAPGRRDYVVEDAYVLPVDVEVLAVQPHAHFRARQVRGIATLPDGHEKLLIAIDDWDFNWQDLYRFVAPVPLPRGAVLRMRISYDNSPANRRNPDRPPRRVRWGENSRDEMGDVWFQVAARTDADRRRLIADFGPKVLLEDAAGYETLLAATPGDARLHEAAGVLYLMVQQVEKARVHLREAVRLDPASASAHYNLGTAHLRGGDADQAIGHLTRALAIQPDHVAAHVNLGAALRSRGQLAEAAMHLDTALHLAPDNAAAHTNRAGVFAAGRRVPEAVRHYRAALAADPDLLEALTDLAWILATAGDEGLRAPAEAIRLAERAVALTGHRSVRALDTLGAAHAAAGRFEEAVAAVTAALRLESGGAGRDQLRARLDLYRRGRAVREP